MMIYYPDFNNNMCTNETENLIHERDSPEKVEYSEHYDSDSETINGYPEVKPSSRHSSVPERKMHRDELKTNSSTMNNTSKRPRSKRNKPPNLNLKPPIVKKTAQSNAYTHHSVVDRWEAAQLALAEANSQNVLLQRQLHECRVELRTVQRQCKMQSARLNKAIGQEADMPQIVDRLTADVRSLQIRLRDKSSQFDAGQRRISELQHRIYVLEKERSDYQAQMALDEMSQRKQGPRLEELQAELQAEKKKTSTLTHQLELANRSHRHQIGLAQEQVRQLRQTCRDLESQLNERTLLLQEKIKLLELQNIYSLRLPKNVPAHLPPAETGHTLTQDLKHSPVMKEDSYLPTLGRNHARSHSQHRLADRNARKISVSLGRMRGGRHTQFNGAPNLPNMDALPDSEAASSVEMKRREPSNCQILIDQESVVACDSPKQLLEQPRCGDLISTEFDQIAGDTNVGENRPDDSTTQTNELSSLDQVGYIADESTMQSYDDRYSFLAPYAQNTVPTESTTASDSDNFRELHAQLTRLSDQNEQLRLIASQHHGPIDMTAATQDPHTSGSSQISSTTLGRKKNEEEHEGKTRFHTALDAMEKSVTHENESSLESTMQDHVELPEDCARFNNKREQELWNELFGSEEKGHSDQPKTVATIHCGHAGLMAKAAHGEGTRSVSNGQSLMGSNAHSSVPQLVENRTAVFKSPTAFSSVNHPGSMVNAAFDRPVPPRRSNFRAFDEEQEADSEFEELHV